MAVKSMSCKFDKLLRVDVEYSKRIESIAITGDFFLHPEEKITEIEDALVGKLVQDHEGMKEAVNEVLVDCELMGFTVNELVDMLKDMTITKFRYIPYQKFSAAMTMALDEAIAESVRAGESDPTIRVYGWEPSAVSIGYFQSLDAEIDMRKCELHEVDVVRRRTGGGAVYHEDELTYSILGPVELFPEGIIDSYREICGIIVEALSELSIYSEFAPINDIQVNDKKISGNAQTRKEGILQQHGTILFTVDVDKMFSLLKVDDEKVSDKFIQSVKKRVTSIKDESDATFSDLLVAMRRAFGAAYSIENGDYTESELSRARELVREKYGNMSWTAMR